MSGREYVWCGSFAMSVMGVVLSVSRMPSTQAIAATELPTIT
jgi:hypothetical protein